MNGRHDGASILGKKYFFLSFLGAEKNCKLFAISFQLQVKKIFFSFNFAAGRAIYQTFSAYSIETVS